MDVLMPQLGETVAEGTLTIWHKAVGDTVENGELLFEIGTDKVEMEVPAPVSGVLKVINVEAGVTVDVGAVLAVIDDGKSDAVTPATTPIASVPSAPSASVASRTRTRDPSLRLSPVVRKIVAENNLDPVQITGTGRDGRIKKSDVLAHMKGAPADQLQTVAPSAPPITPPNCSRVVAKTWCWSDGHSLQSDPADDSGTYGAIQDSKSACCPGR